MGLKIELPDPPKPLGAYLPAVLAGDLLFLSGMLPIDKGAPAIVGTIGLDLTVEEAQRAVRIAVLNGLAAARANLGSLDRVREVVRLSVYQRTTPDFTLHALVADAASELLREVFGEAAGHARMVFGVYSLPAGMPVELELVFRVAPPGA
jgi:enamine deaminase RidA (YjgF/YER057c/UK114 family)